MSSCRGPAHPAHNLRTLKRWNQFLHPARPPHILSLPIGQRVTHIPSGQFGQSQQPLHDLGMLGGHIARLTDVTVQIVETQWGRYVIIAARRSAASRLSSPQGPVHVRQMKLPATAAQSLELVDTVVEEIRLVGTPGSLNPDDEGPDIESINTIG